LRNVARAGTSCTGFSVNVQEVVRDISLVTT
jgi:hypothetical protein